MTEQTEGAEVLDALIAQIDTGLAQGAASIPTPLAWATVSQRLHDLRRRLAADRAAAEVRGAQAERDRRMDYAVVKGYELGYVEALREAADDVFRAASTSGGSPVFRGEIADWLRARAAAAAAGGGWGSMSGLDIEGVLEVHPFYHSRGFKKAACGEGCLWTAYGDEAECLDEHRAHVAAVLREQIVLWLEREAEAGDIRQWSVLSNLAARLDETAAQLAPSRVPGEET